METSNATKAQEQFHSDAPKTGFLEKIKDSQLYLERPPVTPACFQNVYRWDFMYFSAGTMACSGQNCLQTSGWTLRELQRV